MLRIVVYVVSVAVFLAVAQSLVDALGRKRGRRERAGWGWVPLALTPVILVAWYVVTEIRQWRWGIRTTPRRRIPGSERSIWSLRRRSEWATPHRDPARCAGLACPAELSPALAVLANAALLLFLLDMSRNDPANPAAWVWWAEDRSTVLVFAAIFGAQHWVRSRQATRLHRDRAMAE